MTTPKQLREKAASILALSKYSALSFGNHQVATDQAAKLLHEAANTIEQLTRERDHAEISAYPTENTRIAALENEIAILQSRINTINEH